MASAPLLTLPVIAPPLRDVFVRDAEWTGLEVVRPLVHHIYILVAKENDERELRQVDEVDLNEDVLARTRIWCR
jgi:hypothetical protein